MTQINFGVVGNAQINVRTFLTIFSLLLSSVDTSRCIFNHRAYLSYVLPNGQRPLYSDSADMYSDLLAYRLFGSYELCYHHY